MSIQLLLKRPSLATVTLRSLGALLSASSLQPPQKSPYSTEQDSKMSQKCFEQLTDYAKEKKVSCMM